MHATLQNWYNSIKQASANIPRENFRAIGWVPLITVISAIGIGAIAYAYTIAPSNYAGGLWLYWLGVLLTFAPVALRIVSQNPSRNERIVLVIFLGMMLYLIKYLKSPLFFDIHDEFAHWRTTFDIIANHQLFLTNPIKTISPLFPGMEILTGYISEVLGLEIFPVGIAVLFVMRLVFVIALFLFFEKVSNSPYIAGLAVLVYFSNPNFLFFDAQYAYESLGLPLAFLILLLIVFRDELPEQEYRRVSGISIFLIFILTISHHLTSYFVTLFLLLWQALSVVKRDIKIRNLINYVYLWYSGEIAGQRIGDEWRRLIRTRPDPIETAKHEKSMAYSFLPLTALAFSSLWILAVASSTIDYLFPHLTRQVKEILSLISLESQSRELFVSGGQSAPVFGQLVSYLTVVFLLVGVGYGIYILFKAKPENEVVVLLIIGALFYPVTLIARMTQHGWEISNRSSEFIFVAIGFVIAIAIQHFLSQENTQNWKRYLISGLLTIIFIGGMNIGWPYWDFLPGSYLVADGPRSIEAEGLAASAWMKDEFGPGNRIAADRVNTRLLGSYGGQTTITSYAQKIRIAPVFFADVIGEDEEAVIRDGNVNFLLVDMRLCTSLPMVGVYFEDGEPDSLKHSTPIPCSALEKFSLSSLFNKIYDSGSISIYQTIPHITPNTQDLDGDVP